MATDPKEVSNNTKEIVVSDADRLCRAAQLDNVNKFKEILANGVPLNSVSHNGFQAIHYAANYGSITVLTHIIQLIKERNDTEIIQAKTPKGKLALHLAEKNKHTFCYELLKEEGRRVGQILLQKRSESLGNLPPIVPKTYSSDAERNEAFEAEKKDLAEASVSMNQILALSGRKFGTITFNGVDVSKPTPKIGTAAAAQTEENVSAEKKSKKKN